MPEHHLTYDPSILKLNISAGWTCYGDTYKAPNLRYTARLTLYRKYLPAAISWDLFHLTVWSPARVARRLQ